MPQHWGAVETRRKPIIFFHADQPLEARVKIGFPGGQASVWYPATESPAVFGFDKQPKTGGSLEWNLGIKACPNGWQPKNQAPPDVGEKHWIGRIREVKADDIYARFGPNFTDVERDKFLYYDGIFPQGKWLKISVNKDNVELTSLVKHALLDVTVVDRRGETVRVGEMSKPRWRSGQKVEFTEVNVERFPSEAAEVAG